MPTQSLQPFSTHNTVSLPNNCKACARWNVGFGNRGRHAEVAGEQLWWTPVRLSLADLTGAGKNSGH